MDAGAGIVVGLCIFFFFQAEDGIRDADVTGVQTCALPISLLTSISVSNVREFGSMAPAVRTTLPENFRPGKPAKLIVAGPPSFTYPAMLSGTFTKIRSGEICATVNNARPDPELTI